MEKISLVHKDTLIARLEVQYSALQMFNIRYRSRRLRQSDCPINNCSAPALKGVLTYWPVGFKISFEILVSIKECKT